MPIKDPEQQFVGILSLRRNHGSFEKLSNIELPKPTDPAPGITVPVVLVAGGAASLDAKGKTATDELLKNGLRDFHGTVISGGTAIGVPGCVGAIAKGLGRQKHFRLLGYVPKNLPADAPRDTRYDLIVEAGENEFSAAQVLQIWADILAAGITPKSVFLVGIGGGSVSAFEYRVALAFGASVGVVAGTGGGADALLCNPLWLGRPNLYPLRQDSQSIHSFLTIDSSSVRS